MEKKATGKIKLSAVLCGMCIMLAGCSDNLETAGGQDTVQTGGGQAEVNLSKQEQQIRQYEIKYSSGEFEAADYLTLAELYGSQGRIKEQRDMLEQSWRLYEDEAAFSALAEITVNVEEEDEDIRSQAELIMQNLELEEYHNDAVNQVSTEEWFSVMMPKLYEGQRNYYLEADGTQHKLQIKVGFDEAGAPFSEIWYTDGTGQVLYLKKEEASVRMLMTSLSEGLYQGAFESWLCIGTTGDIYHEQGSFSQGVCVGEYTAEVYFGKESTDLYTLWHNREGMEFTTYKGEFDRNGKTLLEQPSPAALETVRGTAKDSSVIIYAYDEKEKKFLFIRVPEAEEAVFDVSAFGIRALPSYTPYEIYTAPAAVSGNGQESGGDGQNGDGQESGGSGSVSGSQTGQEAAVRIYDGNIEWFDGQVWRVLGSVETYQEKDPFLAYEQERKEETAGEGSTGAEGAGGESSEGEGTTSSGTGSIYDRQGAGKIEEPKSPAKPNKNNNSGSGNSGQTQKPDTGNTSGSIDNSGSGGSTGGESGSGSSGGSGGSTGGGGDSGSSGGSGGSTGGGGGSGSSGGSGGSTGGGGDSGSSGGSGGSTGGGGDSGSSGGSGGSTGGGGDSGSSGGSGGDVDVEWTPDIL